MTKAGQIAELPIHVPVQYVLQDLAAMHVEIQILFYHLAYKNARAFYYVQEIQRFTNSLF